MEDTVKQNSRNYKRVNMALKNDTRDNTSLQHNCIRWYDYALLATVILVPTLLYVFCAAITIYHLALEITSEDFKIEWLILYPFGLFTMSVIWLYTVGKFLWALISTAKEGEGVVFDANGEDKHDVTFMDTKSVENNCSCPMPFHEDDSTPENTNSETHK